ncbi:MAG: manganese efflux pump MntP family protein [Candidatus Elarobacter sp.]
MTLRLVSFVLPLGFDTLAVALALGLRGGLPVLRVALVFAAFETLMPVVGILAGAALGARFAVVAQLLGAVVLVVLGAREIREGRESDDADETAGLSFDSLRATFFAGLAISTDELAAGFPLGAARLPVTTLLATIGVQTLVVTAGGMLAGRRIGERLGRRAARWAMLAAGIVFMGLGVALAWEAFAAK